MKLFISYRRKSWAFTHRLADQLGRMIQGDIFVDISGIDETDFEQSILSNLRNSDVVLLIVSEHTFAPDRIQYDDDWVRRGIALALELDKPIVLVCVEGLYPPSPDELSENIRAITRKQGINFYPEYWNAAVQRLTDFVAKVALQGSVQASGNQASLDTCPSNIPVRFGVASTPIGSKLNKA